MAKIAFNYAVYSGVDASNLESKIFCPRPDTHIGVEMCGPVCIKYTAEEIYKLWVEEMKSAGTVFIDEMTPNR